MMYVHSLLSQQVFAALAATNVRLVSQLRQGIHYVLIEIRTYTSSPTRSVHIRGHAQEDGRRAGQYWDEMSRNWVGFCVE